MERKEFENGANLGSQVRKSGTTRDNLTHEVNVKGYLRKEQFFDNKCAAPLSRLVPPG